MQEKTYTTPLKKVIYTYSIIHTIRYKLKQKEIYDALGLKYSAGEFRQT